MLTFFHDLFSAGKKLREAETKILALESALAASRLDLNESQASLARTRQELSVLAAKQETTVKEMVSFQAERLFKELATPVAQLSVQSHLSSQRPLSARDVLSVSMRLVESLSAFGLKLEGKIGDIVSFDSNRHEGLSLQAESPEEGSQVKITMPGVSYNEVLIRKVAVVSAVAAQSSSAPGSEQGG
jgi:molecular chaperone GrpE (heat shock protein)